MSVTILRDAFNNISTLKNVRCIKVRMYYTDADGKGDVKRDHQVLEFDVLGPDGQQTIKSDPIPNGRPLVTEALKIAAKL